MRINPSSSSSTKTTTKTPKISEKSFNHSKKLENFWVFRKLSFHRQTSTNFLTVRKSCTIQFSTSILKGLMNWFSLKNTATCTTFVHGNEKILHNSFWKTWHKNFNAPGDVNKLHKNCFTCCWRLIFHQLSKRQTHPGMFAQIF